MRVAMELDDEGARVLAELVRGQREQILLGTGSSSRSPESDVNRRWNFAVFCIAESYRFCRCNPITRD